MPADSFRVADDGKLRRIAVDGAVSDLAGFGMKWIEQLASHALDKGKGLIAAGVGKVIHLFDESGKKLKEWTHPSTVTGLSFDAKGKRVAASHYNGATLLVRRGQDRHTAASRVERQSYRPGFPSRGRGRGDSDAGKRAAWLAAAGRAAHAHERLSTKTTSMSFSKGGKWLASSGSDAMVLWPFFGGGPMGKAPIELAGGDGINCTQVACNPKDEIVAGGFEDGLVVVANIGSSRIIPVRAPWAWAGLNPGLEPGWYEARDRHGERVLPRSSISARRAG